MPRNILLITLDTLEADCALQYYSVKTEYGFHYCEAMQSIEASARYILSRYPIDEIRVIGDEVNPDGSSEKSYLLKDAGALFSEDPGKLSAFDLFRYRIAQYIGEQSLEQQAYASLLPEEERTKLADFTRDFLEKHSRQDTKRLNRLFNELACSRQLYDLFRNELFKAFANARKNPQLYMRWVKNYLYMQLKPSAKLEILPVNENSRIRFFPADMLDKREYWLNSVLSNDPNAPEADNEIRLYVSLSNTSSIDAHLVLNLLDILTSTPGNRIHLKKNYKVADPARHLVGEIQDNSAVSLSTDLVIAAHAFLNYGKTDMLVSFWENSGERDERISRLIYAARHVDVGISMCNTSEIQLGIRMLRSLFTDARSWTGESEYGLLFGMLAGCIESDYTPLLSEDGNISFIGLIKWAYRHRLYQQVLTLIESDAPMHFVKTGIFYYCDSAESAPAVTRGFARKLLEMKPYEYFKMNDLDHYFVKNYDRESVRFNRNQDRNLMYAILRAQSIENQDPEKVSGHTACDSIETVQNVLYAYFHLSAVRNKISHADADGMAETRLIVSDKDFSSAMIMMKESIEYFIMCYEKAQGEVQGKKPTIISISSDNIHSVAMSMKRAKNQAPQHDDSPA